MKSNVIAIDMKSKIKVNIKSKASFLPLVFNLKDVPREKMNIHKLDSKSDQKITQYFVHTQQLLINIILGKIHMRRFGKQYHLSWLEHGLDRKFDWEGHVTIFQNIEGVFFSNTDVIGQTRG